MRKIDKGGSGMWCPKCKTEYRKGITICVDCGSDLVEGTEDDFVVVDLCDLKDEATADRLMEYLSFSGIEKAEKKEEGGVFIITVPEREAKQAEKLLRGFMLASSEDKEKEDREKEKQEQENREEYDESDMAEGFGSENADEVPEELLYTTSKAYTKKADEYKDVKFSGITFIIFGLIGMAYILLCKFEILPISYNEIVFICILCMFAAFVTGGIVSVVKSGRIRKQIAEEEALTAEIKLWLDAEITKEMIIGWKDESASDVENDLIITSKLRARLVKNYPQLDIAYIEMVADEYFSEKIADEIG